MDYNLVITLTNGVEHEFMISIPDGVDGASFQAKGSVATKKDLPDVATAEIGDSYIVEGGAESEAGHLYILGTEKVSETASPHLEWIDMGRIVGRDGKDGTVADFDQNQFTTKVVDGKTVITIKNDPDSSNQLSVTGKEGLFVRPASAQVRAKDSSVRVAGIPQDENGGFNTEVSVNSIPVKNNQLGIRTVGSSVGLYVQSAHEELLSPNKTLSIKTSATEVPFEPAKTDIDVAISKEDGNSLVIKEDGLFSAGVDMSNKVDKGVSKNAGEAIGLESSATQTKALAVGAGATAEGQKAIAIGGGAAIGGSSIAIGTGAKAKGAASIVIGEQADSQSYNNVVVGTSAKAPDVSSVAVGHQAVAGGKSSVAVGQGANTTEQGTATFGSSSNRRRIVHVEDGQDDYDAVNMKQLNERKLKRKASSGNFSWNYTDNKGAPDATGKIGKSCYVKVTMTMTGETPGNTDIVPKVELQRVPCRKDGTLIPYSMYVRSVTANNDTIPKLGITVVMQEIPTHLLDMFSLEIKPVARNDQGFGVGIPEIPVTDDVFAVNELRYIVSYYTLG